MTFGCDVSSQDFQWPHAAAPYNKCPSSPLCTSCSCSLIHPSLATANARQHIRRLVPQRAPKPASASPPGAGETAPEEGQQPGGGEEHAVQRHGLIQAENREHAERSGGEDQ